MASIYLIISAILSFLISWILGKKLIPYLHKLKYGQTILEDGPSWHKNKQGTPTMGGIMFIVSIIVSSLICIVLYQIGLTNQNSTFLETPLAIAKAITGLIMALLFGIIGFIDDYVKVVKKRNLGLTARQKLILQFLVAFSYLISLYVCEKIQGGAGTTYIMIPWLGRVELGVFYWPICAILIVGIVNATNLTDGIDGLNASVTFFNGIFLMIISGVLGMVGFGIISAALVGGCLGFLIFNMHPAKVFMGDTGSLFLGGMICAIIFGMNIPVILPIIGAVYVMEMFSVMLQVTYFKLTKGKRLFKMSPIHHHFEMCGFSEYKICAVFSGLAIFFGILSVLIVKLFIA